MALNWDADATASLAASRPRPQAAASLPQGVQSLSFALPPLRPHAGQPMNRKRSVWAPFLMLLFLPVGAEGQAASEQATLTQIVSGTEIEVAWSRPSLRGREEIFGRQIPWGEVWTPGANRATTIRFSKDVVMAGTPVPAGRYSVWIRVLESEPWRMALHADTTLFHSAHPPIDEAVLHVGVERTRTEDLQESLAWDVDRIRIDGADLVMHWGRDQVVVPLEVDPGIVFATAPAEAQPLVGEWMYDDRASLPPADRVAGIIAQSENPTGRFYKVFLAEPRPRPVRIDHDEDSGLVLFVDPLLEAAEAAFYSGEGEQPVVAYGQALLPRGTGFFAVAGTLGGEVSAMNPQFASIVEFEYDDEGRAVAFTIRGPDDEIEGRGVRSGG